MKKQLFGLVLSCYCHHRLHGVCFGTAGHRCAGFRQRHDHHQRQAAAAARPEIRRGDQGKSLGIDPVVAAPCGAAEEGAQRAADHDRRRRLRLAQHLRRRDPDPGARPHRQERPALHELPFDLPLLADARSADHRAQPPLGGLRCGRRDRHRLPRLRLDHPDREGHHRHHPAGQRLRDLVVRQGSQHAVLRQQPGRARSSSGPTAWASSTSGALSAATPASGSRTCSATRRRSSRSRAIPAGTCKRRWPTRRSSTCDSRRRWHRRSPSSFTTCPAPRTRRITRRRSGSRRSAT